MPNLDPTYLRYIYDNLILGSIHPENASELPEGLIGLYEEAFEEHLPVMERQLLLKRFALFTLIKKEVSVAFVSEILGESETDALLLHQRFGNLLATMLIRLFYGVRFTDLGPFRAIRWNTLLALNMEDIDFGWTVEMQVKAAKNKLVCVEVPVNYRKRLGESKISGTIKGSILAGYKIIWTIFKLL